jgi:hypothetical protein
MGRSCSHDQSHRPEIPCTNRSCPPPIRPGHHYERLRPTCPGHRDMNLRLTSLDRGDSEAVTDLPFDPHPAAPPTETE